MKSTMWMKSLRDEILLRRVIRRFFATLRMTVWGCFQSVGWCVVFVAPSGRELPTESGEGECVKNKPFQEIQVARAPSVAYGATFLPEEGFLDSSRGLRMTV